MTSEEARQYFKDTGLDYDILTIYNIDLLINMLNAEILKMRKEQDDCILISVNDPKRNGMKLKKRWHH